MPDDAGEDALRSMDGLISTFRIWSVETDGHDICSAAPMPGLELSYILSDTGNLVHDISGHDRIGDVHDADWSDERPPFDQTLCPTWQLQQNTPPPPPPAAQRNGAGKYVALFILVLCMGLSARGMKEAFDRGVFMPKNLEGGIYAEMEKESAQKDARIKELEDAAAASKPPAALLTICYLVSVMFIPETRVVVGVPADTANPVVVTMG